MVRVRVGAPCTHGDRRVAPRRAGLTIFQRYQNRRSRVRGGVGMGMGVGAGVGVVEGVCVGVGVDTRA